MFILVDGLTVCWSGSIDEETETPSLQNASARSWGLSDDKESRMILDICTWASEQFPLSLTTKHFLGDLWIITSEEEECRLLRKKQHKKKKMGWAVPALSSRKLNPKA